jgi:hypothetical protein
MSSLQKRLRDLERQFPGWRAELTNGSHIRLTHEASGRCIFTSGTTAHKADLAIIRQKVRALLREVQG